MGKVKSDFYEVLQLAGISYKKNYPVAKHTSFKIGGRVECYLTVNTVEELSAVLSACRKYGKKPFVAGNLSNVLIADGIIKMVFIRLKGEFEDAVYKGTIVRAGAAVSNGTFLSLCAKNGIGGFEFLSGIPGTLGGAVYMNAGAFGKGIGAGVTAIYVMDEAGRPGVVINPEKAFSYRHSIFQDNGMIILAAELKGKKRVPAAIRKEMADIIKMRHSRHPWRAACAGSFFKNPQDKPAGRLIEEAGLKGLKCGGAMVSQMHGNFLINTGKATFKDVMKLSEMVKKAVYKKSGVKLREEVRIVK
ncbi:MAG: UDP-N-acetylmuramate dehydrogenase [Spirochaetia bacterium]|nr:UDP-N-acetylmuramate dehydrogenase [Spirochaetia bacterium]